MIRPDCRNMASRADGFAVKADGVTAGGGGTTAGISGGGDRRAAMAAPDGRGTCDCCGVEDEEGICGVAGFGTADSKAASAPFPSRLSSVTPPPPPGGPAGGAPAAADGGRATATGGIGGGC